MPSIPTTMRQVRFNGAGGPEVIGIETAPVPKPGPGQVLIEVVAAGVNRPDCQQRAGKYPPPPGATEVPGLEVGGRIAALGEGVTGLAVGDEVCALVISGGYAEYSVADAALCLPRPKPLSLTEAAGLPENYYTVWTNVFERGRLRRGERILVHGGSSGIGYTAIQLAKQFGATVYATAGSAEKCAFCEQMGADAAINYREADFAAEVKRLTDGSGVDVILDMVGAPYLERNLASLALEGRLVVIAFMQGFKAESFNMTPVMIRRLTLTGSTLRPRTVAQKAAIAEGLRREVWPLLDAGTLKTVIHATFPLEQAREAHALMESSAHLGKIMLVTGR
ncbi:NAD(P)H-quinone oxidoreductase [Methylobacterium isbiliense]|jgi:putative PIG3 family NAD(P)H quinone oxidoreductase|uniref:Phthiocerol synthesis polyketide synthase type I PpsC n=1 Tax=Methylobacterium isbiliense TaxID=315478 RepID=A0ABQ4SFZ6_9HYPH|nr:NAD(P)H-quinone oxidoreductase [Methylobacterium isbiliense]MDN3624168.1 NAD(P)H-quinone oxidoreductase [Methylobacterium isbiliense]GJE01318.1 Phthiocerol synthesis polyketide synthase type I PpsC [Methylobacterium isbiliense]